MSSFSAPSIEPKSAWIVASVSLGIMAFSFGAESSWRIAALLLLSGSGMETGGWLAGILYDYFGYYAPAFAIGVTANLLNFAMIATLVIRQNHVTLRAQ